MSTGLAELFSDLLRTMSFSDYSLHISTARRERLLRSLVETYYSEPDGSEVVFDSNRAWCNLLSPVVQLFPDARVICCVRSPAWILDSLEQLVQRNTFQVPKIFGPDAWQNVYTRAEWVMGPTGMIGSCIQALRQAWYGQRADRLVVLRYESLVKRPAEVLSMLYTVLGEVRFEHNFETIEFDAPEFDCRLGLPGLHKVAGPVGEKARTTILPADLFSRYDHSFWETPADNPKGVLVL